MTADWYVEKWIADASASAARVLTSQRDRITANQQSELQAELDLYQAALHFVRTGAADSRASSSAPSPVVIGAMRANLHRSIERATQSLDQTKKLGLTQQSRSLEEDLGRLERLLGYLEQYWAGLPSVD
jgi:hypothetical protein